MIPIIELNKSSTMNEVMLPRLSSKEQKIRKIFSLNDKSTIVDDEIPINNESNDELMPEEKVNCQEWWTKAG